ncbi:MAG TPA: putative monovalent cation/H+ antiporter subunit A [Candidatus Binatia bacterium]
MLAAIFSSFAASLLAPRLYRMSGRAAGWFLALLPGGLTLYFGSFIAAVSSGEVFLFSYDWAPSLGIRFSFSLDGLSLLFAILISAIGALIIIYSSGYLAGHSQLGRFFVYILLFMGSMLGIVLADNLMTLFVFWELTSISSYLLIGFDHESEDARAAALQALLVTSGGGLALLAGFLLLGHIGATMEISALAESGATIRSDPLYRPIVLLVLAGAFTKSAQVPFHFWLPGAMVAPTPVSAYLHSATMVKAGVYLLARLTPVLGGTELWMLALTTAGATTMAVGAYLALRQTDLKLILAYLTVSALGILVLFIGLGTSEAIIAAVVFLLGHALYKGALFLVVGIVDHETGTRDVGQLRGLLSAMPLTAALAAMAALSLAALPPAFGFIGKELLLEASLGAETGAALMTMALVAASSVFVAAAAMIAIRPFFGRKSAAATRAHEAPFTLWLAPLVLSVCGILFGAMPNLVEAPLVRAGVQAVMREPVSFHLALWHGLNLPLGLSALSLLCGAALYAGRRRVHDAAARLQITSWWGPQHWYGQLLAGMNALAKRQTQLLQNGYLRFYLLIIVAATVALVAAKLFRAIGSIHLPAELDVRFYEWIIAALIPIGALTAIMSRSRLGAVAALGVVGYSVGLIFVLFSAPDLAMTQFMVETLTVILFVLVFYHLPRFTAFSPRLILVRDAVTALTFGGLITVIVAVGSGIQLYPKISNYFVENSLALAHGRNVVNTILVDFREFDTFGEITVLAVAGIGVYALLRLRPRKEKTS